MASPPYRVRSHRARRTSRPGTRDVSDESQSTIYPRIRPRPHSKSPRPVFVAHGHDHTFRDQIVALLRKMQLEPTVVEEVPDCGRTLYEKVIAEAKRAGFALVLYSPDDFGGDNDKPQFEARVRQNALFEHGLLLGVLRPEKVCVLCRGQVDLPSDLHGLLFKQIPENANPWIVALTMVKELRAAGYLIDLNDLLED